MAKELFRNTPEINSFFKSKSSKIFMISGYFLGAQSVSNCLLALQEGQFKQAAGHGILAAGEIGGSTFILAGRKKANNPLVTHEQ